MGGPMSVSGVRASEPGRAYVGCAEEEYGLARRRRRGERSGTYVLAPKLKKNWRKAKQTMNAGVLSESNLAARTATATSAYMQSAR